MWPTYAIWHQNIWSSLIQVTSCCLLKCTSTVRTNICFKRTRILLKKCIPAKIVSAKWRSFFFRPQCVDIYNMTRSSHGDISALLVFCAEHQRSPVWIPLTKVSNAELGCLFDVRLENVWANNRDAGDLRRHDAHYDVTVMSKSYEIYARCFCALFRFAFIILQGKFVWFLYTYFSGLFHLRLWKWSITTPAHELHHYYDVIMSPTASQITSLTIVYSIVYRAQIKENIKAPRHWPLCGEFTEDRWIPRTNGQLRGKCFHLMTSSWWRLWPSEIWLFLQQFIHNNDHQRLVVAPYKGPVTRKTFPCYDVIQCQRDYPEW